MQALTIKILNHLNKNISARLFHNYSNFFALELMKMANQKNKIYFTATISKYFNTPSIGRLVNSALLTFSAAPKLDDFFRYFKPIVFEKVKAAFLLNQ
ncbi:hypothetical protein DDZ16_09365 [Marinilabilia rubra]|uniref:Uncharacterized protein n=1 Tax=Marinilabilia rubra TaxID=2162893 RepID=A0A2U2B9A1_9BACT|nr:hypothetical protein DDZ16_09365 [Marinilabilia rubra]